jgi:epsilon-lactone hydrolase
VAGDIRIENSPVGPVVYPPDHSDAVILYLHGDADPDSTMDTAERLARSTGATVVCPRYRSTFPDAFEDARAGYRYCKHAGPVTVVGERIGAGLAAALLVHLRDLGAALPRSAVFVSGLLDLTMRANSLLLNARADPTSDVTRLKQRVADYAGGAVLTDPLLSPLYANLHGLPPVQLLVAGTDPLLDDSLAFATRAARSRVTVDLRVWPDATSFSAEGFAAMTDFITTWDPTRATASAMSA